MVGNHSPENATIIIDPFWFKYSERIREIGCVLASPNTPAGENLLKKLTNSVVIKAYPRLYPIFSALVALVECDEMDRINEKDYFSEPGSKIIVLKAMGLLFENSIDSFYPEGESKVYGDYQKFSNNLQARLKLLETQISGGIKPPNFVNSLIRIVVQEINKLKGMQRFDINTERFRRGIGRYLNYLNEKNTDAFSVIQARIEEPMEKFAS